MYINVIFLETVIRYLETEAEFSKMVTFFLITILILSVCAGICTYCDHIIAPAGNQFVYEKLYLRMFDKATDVERERFKNPEFYNQYTKTGHPVFCPAR